MTVVASDNILSKSARASNALLSDHAHMIVKQCAVERAYDSRRLDVHSYIQQIHRGIASVEVPTQKKHYWYDK